ncbi:MAG: hypothetical protein K2J39_00200 [Ruminococcus sp.]|nr:hypothetical protein [Ruminococcus sp.]
MKSYNFIKNENGSEFFELTAQQKFMLDDDETNKGFVDRCAGTFNVPVPIRLYGNLDIARFEESIRKTIEYYDSLRIMYFNVNGGFKQKFIEKLDFKLKVTEAEGDTKEEREKFAMDNIVKFVNAPINTDTNMEKIMWNYVLYKIDEKDHIFVFMMHHSMSDGTSQQLMGRTLLNFYSSADNGEPKLYREYVKYDREFKESERGRKQIEYWHNELKDYQEIDLALIAPKEKETEKHVIFKTDMKLMDSICAKTGISRLVAYMAAYHIALSRILNNLDVVIGLSCANRTKIRFLKTLGYFSRAAQNRVILREDMKLTELLDVLKEKISKNVEAQQTADLNEQGQFMISYGAYKVVTGRQKLNDDIECEILQVNPERAFRFFIICAYEYPDYVLSDLHGNPNVFSIEFQEKLADYIQRTLEAMNENTDNTVGGIMQK